MHVPVDITEVMSKLGKTALSAMLLAVAVSCSLAGTLPNDETEVLDLQEYLESSRGVPTKHKADGALLREKRQFRLNDYQIELYLNLRLLQASNCTETFLNQTVSPHLCNSKWVLYTPLTGILVYYVSYTRSTCMYKLDVHQLCLCA